MKSHPRIIIPRRTESSIIESYSSNVPGNGEWTVSMKLHQDNVNFTEAVQLEVEAQREAIARLSIQQSQRSPTKKGTRVRGSEEEEKNEDGMWSPQNFNRSPKKEKSALLKALTPKKIKSSLSSVLKKQKTGVRQDSEDSPDKKEEIEFANDNLLNQNQTFNKSEGKLTRFTKLILCLEMFQRILEIGSDYTSKWERVSTNPVITIDKIRVKLLLNFSNELSLKAVLLSLFELGL